MSVVRGLAGQLLYYWLRDVYFFFFFQAEDGIRDVERSRGLGDVYKRQVSTQSTWVSKDSETLALAIEKLNSVFLSALQSIDKNIKSTTLQQKKRDKLNKSINLFIDQLKHRMKDNTNRQTTSKMTLHMANSKAH
eukprot:TRINITY_DN29307_c0_g1_i1.p1 TRINITY_DN29307_c0_g1~~TRINITY_DN29307_c0_g1_i1.p1  ORF type:complete len:135 (-),score=35.85 TRINITY_DN29307_c0_g1_i1:38-442(-)